MTAAHARFIGEFYGSFFAWVSLAGLLFQSFFVSRIFKAIGPGGALFVGPAIALVGYSVILAAPVLTARQALFLPVARPVSCIRERLWGLRYTLSLRSIWRSRAFGFGSRRGSRATTRSSRTAGANNCSPRAKSTYR